MFTALWDDDYGPEILQNFPEKVDLDLNEVADRIFLSFQTVFGVSSEISFEKTTLVLPLKSIKKIAKIILDSISNEKIRGGKQPFIIVLLFPEEFPKDQLSEFDDILELMADLFKNERKLNLKHFFEQIITISIQNIQDLIDEGNREFKKKDYKDSIDLFEDAIKIMEIFKIKKNYSYCLKKLKISKLNYAKKLNEKGKAFLFKKMYENARDYFDQALNLAEDINNRSLIKDIRKNIAINYTNWALQIEKNADSLFNKKNYKMANQKYELAIKLAKKARNNKLVDKLYKKSAKAPNISLTSLKKKKNKNKNS